jgi:lipoprotein-releasing system permease protein
MHFSFFLARHFTRRGGAARGGFGRLTVGLAVASIALGVAVMSIALAVVQGFDEALTAKIVGFVAEVEIRPYRPSTETTKTPLEPDPTLAATLRARVPQLVALEPVVNHEGLLQTPNGHEGVRLKGVAPGWASPFFQNALVQGRLPVFPAPTDATPSREVLISQTLARRMGVALNDDARLVFFQNETARFRKVKVVGLYDTGLYEFDAHVVVCDLRLLLPLLGWQPGQAEAYEARLAPGSTPAQIAQAADELNQHTPHTLRATPVQDRHPELFDWIGLQHQNVWFILVLMGIVAVVNMATAILILITERTQAVGLLRSLGATAGQVRGAFLYQALFLVGVGVLAGNALAFGLLALQQATEWITLDAESYFVKTVPIAWPWAQFAALNVGVVALCMLAMLLPTLVVNRLTPVRALRFR